MNMRAVTSPCTGICKLDAETGWCLGCGRSGPEMDGWGTRPEPWRAQIWAQIPARLAQLGVACRRLDWSTDEIRDFAAATLARGTSNGTGKGPGTWTMGVVGAVAEFCPASGAPVTVETQGNALIAKTAGGALRLHINDDIRAVTFDPPDTPFEACRIALVAKRERGRLPVAPGVHDLGPDADALIQDDPGDLFDLGLGRKEARFSVRVSDEATKEALRAAQGLPLLEALPRIGGALLGNSPTRVVQSALGRIEVQGDIPPPGGASPDGPHTHLLPDHLATGRAMPVGMDLPKAYLPGAIFYPRQG